MVTGHIIRTRENGDSWNSYGMETSRKKTYKRPGKIVGRRGKRAFCTPGS